MMPMLNIAGAEACHWWSFCFGDIFEHSEGVRGVTWMYVLVLIRSVRLES